MKKNIVLITALISFSFCFSQIYGSYETDQNGKIFYHSFNKSQKVKHKNNSAPSELQLDWSNPDFDVSDNPSQDSWNPRLAVGNDGSAYVVYSDNYTNGLQKIMFRKKVVGQDWSEPIYVDTGGEIEGNNNHFPAIAVSPNGDLHVTYNVWANENVRNYIGYSYYNAATDTWSDGVKISDAGGTVNHNTSHHDIYSTEDNLPVVVWGYDFRENQVNEEIYMKYFDGANWSSDIPVSDITDGQNAGYPNIKSMGDQKAMIIYSEGSSGGGTELKYKIYDETTHNLTAAKIIASENIFSNNYVLATSPAGDVMVLTIHKETAPDRDVLNIFEYDRNNDSFNLSSNTFEVAANAGGLLKQISMDCNADGDCAVVYTDFLAETNSYLKYDKTSGFGTPLVINEENPGVEPPSALFDPNGNLHVVWNDYRFDDGQGFDEREVIYEKGVNTLLGLNNLSFPTIAIYPNPAKEQVTISSHKDITSIIVVNQLGAVIKKQSHIESNQYKLDVSNFAAGIYYVRINTAQGETTNKKIIVSN